MCAAPKKPRLILAAVIICVAAGAHAQEMAAVVPEEKPPTVERFEEPAAPTAGQTNSAGFRFTYPVRDAQSDQLFTEANPPATGDAPSQQQPATGSTTVPSPQQPPSVTENAQALQDEETSLELAEETFIGEEVLPQQPWADVGEGRFEKRPFRYSFAMYEGYNSNVNGSTTDPVESLYTAIEAGMDYAFGSSRLNLGISLDAELSFYYNNKQLQNDGIFPTITLGLNANYKATPRLDISFVSSTGLLSQPDFASGTGGPSNYQGDYITSSTTLSAAYRWAEKFNTVTSYAPLVTYYFQPTGSNLSNFDQTIGQQFVFLWKPLTQLVAEYRFNLRSYLEQTDYNSLGNYALLGFNYKPGKRTAVTFRGGAEQRISQNPIAGGTYNYLGPFGQMDFTYAFGERTSVGLTSRYGTTGTGVNDYTQNQQFLVGLSASHRLGRRLNIGAFLNYQNNYYAQPGGEVNGVDLTPSFSYNVFNAGLSAGYFILPDRWSLQAGYNFTTQVSGNTEQQGDYTQNVVFLGTQLDF